VVAIDPAVTSNKDSNETGIIVAGKGVCRCQGSPEVHGFILSDASGVYTPSEWGNEAVARYRHHKADRVIGEVNNGGDLVESNLRTVDKAIPYRAVHASRGKAIRAEPISALYEQGRVHHVGDFPKLEDQLTTWDPTAGMKSPDRLDAAVWALTELMVSDKEAPLSDIKFPDLTRGNRWNTLQ
jgi:phage terminase large subunit-like protein